MLGFLVLPWRHAVGSPCNPPRRVFSCRHALT
jgi:hypothetical protein